MLFNFSIMPWYGRWWEESALPLEMHSHGLAHTATAREVLLSYCEGVLFTELKRTKREYLVP